MPSNWLNKILSHKATPPDAVWKNIANELDKEIVTNDIKTKMFEYNVLPPESAWMNISNELDKEATIIPDFKTKILSYESDPPHAVLDNIFSALEREEKQLTPAFVNRIYNYKQEAPVNTWKEIIKELDKSEAKLVPLKSIKKNLKVIYFRMAAAASVIIFIAASVWLSNKKTNNATDQTASVTPQSQQKNVQVAEKEKTNLPASDTQEKKMDQRTAVYNNTKKTPEQNNVGIQDPAYVKGNIVTELATDPNIGIKEKLQNINGETPMDIALMNTPNTYISITGPDGQTVKVSSKFSNLIGFLNEKNPDTQENLDIIIKESAKWRTTFTAWRNKMANNSVAPSLANFMDIIELSKVLEEK